MPDNPNKRGKADRERVSLIQGHEVRYWCDRFDCSEQQLRDAVDAVGDRVDAIEAYLAPD